MTAADPVDSDLTAPVITRLGFKLFELWAANYASSGMVIRDKRFVNCVIEGPAIMLPVKGCRFDGCDFGDARGDMRNLLVRPLSPTRITGAIAVEDCVFETCRFFAVGFTGSEPFLESMLSVAPEG